MHMNMENFYVSTPEGEVLQMCFMRPEPEQLCPSLPFLIEAPELSTACLDIDPMPMEAQSVLLSLPSREYSGVTSSSERVHLFLQALVRDEETLPDVSLIPSSEWEQALLAAPSENLEALMKQISCSPSRLLQLARSLRAEKVCDALLERQFCDLLSLEEGSKKLHPLKDHGCSSHTFGDSSDLPFPFSDLLSELLHNGSVLRLARHQFQQHVIDRLHNAGALGPCAATQAAQIYEATSSKVQGLRSISFSRVVETF